MKKALENGTRFRLSRERAELFRSRVSGEWRLEIRQMNPWQLKRYSGLIRERINFQDRWFIPKSEAGENTVTTKREQVMEQIDAMSLTNKQKDALYFAFGYAESKLYDTPWH